MKIKIGAFLLTTLFALPMAGQAAIVQNGSFENLQNTWTNTEYNYMAVASGSTAITAWNVVGAVSRGVAWAQSPTNDGYSPSAGSYFVDLSGFGTEAGPNATLEQILQNLISGQTYNVGIDYWGDAAKVSIGGTVIATGASSSASWTHLATTFTASSTQELLAIGYSGQSGVAFVDNLTVTGPDSSVGGGTVPEPGTMALVIASLGIIGIFSHRRCI